MMALVYKCDRCGKIMDNSYESGINNVINRVFYISSSKMSEDQDYYDLCTDCYESFAEWWNAITSKDEADYPFIKEKRNDKNENMD